MLHPRYFWILILNTRPNTTRPTMIATGQTHWVSCVLSAERPVVAAEAMPALAHRHAVA